jgi:hypothetical protein
MTVDVSEWIKAFQGLDDLKESLARRMGVSAGQIVRDDAKERAPIGDPYKDGYGAAWKTGSDDPGALKEAIYLAFNEKQSNAVTVVYSVSWNAKKAFWGVFKEFGFVMQYATFGNSGSGFWTDKSYNQENRPLQIKAEPFLAPALDSNISKIRDAALNRGKEEFQKLLQEIKT